MSDELLVLLLPQLNPVVVDSVAVLDEMVVITALTRDDSTARTGCGHDSTWERSRYQRHVTDEAGGGRPVRIDLTVRRLNCENTDCPKTTFAEQVEGLTVRYQRRTPAPVSGSWSHSVMTAPGTEAMTAATAGAEAARTWAWRLKAGRGLLGEGMRGWLLGDMRAGLRVRVGAGLRGEQPPGSGRKSGSDRSAGAPLRGEYVPSPIHRLPCLPTHPPHATAKSHEVMLTHRYFRCASGRPSPTRKGQPLAAYVISC